jgi:hypothetical protein
MCYPQSELYCIVYLDYEGEGKSMYITHICFIQASNLEVYLLVLAIQLGQFPIATCRQSRFSTFSSCLH